MSFLRTCLAVLFGFLLGVALYRPQSVKASSSVTLTAVKAGYNSYIPGGDIIGFACTHDTCYIAAK